MDVNIRGRRVFITGGTGSIGMALVSIFAENGGDVYFQYHSNATRAHQLVNLYGAHAVQMDLTGNDHFPDVDVDILINNAGINVTKHLAHEISPEDWTRTLRINLDAPYRASTKYLPPMMSRGWGRIINVSSIFGLRATTNNLPYNCSKHGLSGLTKSIAKEYAVYGITCNEVCPGPVESDLMSRIALIRERDTGISKDAYLATLRESIPAKRFAMPIEIAHLALFLASEYAAHINGASIVVDGGATA